MLSVFINQEAEEIFQNEGCIVLPLLSENEVKQLKEFCIQFNIADRNIYTTDRLPGQIEQDKARLIRDKIFESANRSLKKHLVDFRLVLADFLTKGQNAKSFIPPHQDCTLTDEEEALNPTIFCWTPLVDTSLENGAIGVIKGSHRALDAPSPPFPNPRVPRYQDEHVFELFRYLHIFEMKAGEALFFNSKVLHGSLPNFSGSDRPAIRIGIIHQQAPLVHYFLKPGSNKSIMQKYKIDEDFFIKYTNESLVQLYDDNNGVNEYDLIEELPFRVSNYSIDELVNKLNESGMKPDEDDRILTILSKRDC